MLSVTVNVRTGKRLSDNLLLGTSVLCCMLFATNSEAIGCGRCVHIAKMCIELIEHS